METAVFEMDAASETVIYFYVNFVSIYTTTIQLKSVVMYEPVGLLIVEELLVIVGFELAAVAAEVEAVVAVVLAAKEPVGLEQQLAPLLEVGSVEVFRLS